MRVVAAGYSNGLVTALADSAWRLLQLAIERAWSALDVPFFCFLVQTGIENDLSPCIGGSISDFLASFQSGGAFLGRRALTIERMGVENCPSTL